MLWTLQLGNNVMNNTSKIPEMVAGKTCKMPDIWYLYEKHCGSVVKHSFLRSRNKKHYDGRLYVRYVIVCVTVQLLYIYWINMYVASLLIFDASIKI